MAKSSLRNQVEFLSQFSEKQLNILLPGYQSRRTTLVALKGLSTREVAREEGVTVPKVRKALNRAAFYMEIFDANSK